MDLISVLNNFNVKEGKVTYLEPYGEGHINVTYLVIIDKKYKKHLFTWFFTLVAIFGSYVIISTYFLGKDIEFNGAKIVSGSLLDAMMKTDGQILGKILSSVALIVPTTIPSFTHSS